MSDITTKILNAAEQHPHLIAISTGKEQITYQQLRTVLLNVAGNAQKFGMRPGERIIYATRTTPTTMAAALGLIHAGLTLAFVDPLTADDIFAARATAVDAQYTLADPILYLLSKPVVSGLLRKTRGINIANFSTAAPVNLSLGKKLPVSQSLNITRWMAEASPFTDQHLPESRDIAIIFTSGTTGDPKGVVHTAASLVANVDSFADKFGINPGKLVFTDAMTYGLTALARGAHWQLPQKNENIPDCDIYFGVPTYLLEQLTRLEKLPAAARPKIGLVSSGAAPILPSLINRIYGVLGSETLVYGVYGMTEMLPVAVIEGREKIAYTGAGDLVGTLIGDTTVTFKTDNEVIVAGSGLMRGYLNKEPITALSTGDVGKLLDDGRLLLTGRKKDMFIRGNMNIYPGLYEPGLSNITGVEQAALVGVADKYGDDYIALAITIQPGHDRATVVARTAREMKLLTDADAVPDTVVVLESMPTAGRSFKLDRQALHEQVTQILAARSKTDLRD